MTTPIVLDRRLAIRLLHEAQIAAPESIHGVVGAVAGVPAGYGRDEAELAKRGQQLWAALSSYPTAPAVPKPTDLREGQLRLLVSLNTKGVLELRAWTLSGGQVLEIPLSIRD